MSELTSADRPAWGVMSVAEMARHLRLSFAMALGEMPVQPVPIGVPGGMAKMFALWVPMEWPRGVRTVPELERGAPAMDGNDFELERSGLDNTMSRFLETPAIPTEHPMFGHMSMRDWMRWGYLHTDHHLRQFGR